MNKSILFRAGKTLVAGRLVEVDDKGTYHVEAQLRAMRGGGFLPLQTEVLQVHERCVINESFELPQGSLLEAEAEPYSQTIHESLIPLVHSFRKIDLHTCSLVAYERNRRGLGFLDESGDVSWLSVNNALSHSEFSQRLAVESCKPQLFRLGLWERSKTGDIYEQSHLLQTSMHVYMKEGPFRDISKIHEGTDVWVTGYSRGCVIIEADGEEFWRPIEESQYIPVKKDDWYYFSLDADQNGTPDPLDFLPSKPGLSTYPGSARREDNYNAQPDLPRVAGHFRAVPQIPNPDWYIFGAGMEDEDNIDIADAIASGADVDEILGNLSKK